MSGGKHKKGGAKKIENRKKWLGIFYFVQSGNVYRQAVMCSVCRFTTKQIINQQTTSVGVKKGGEN